MDSSALYYLFSTTAQTLAAAVGFLAALVLLRLQEWESKIIAHRDAIDTFGITATPDMMKLYQAIRANDRVAFSGIWNAAQKDFRGGSLTHLSQRFSDLQELIPRRAVLVSQFWRTIAVAAGAIGYNLLALPFVPALSAWIWLAWMAAGVSLIGVAACGLKFHKLLSSALKMTTPRFAGEGQEM